MENRWNLLSKIHSGKFNEIEATSFIPYDSSWFTGHFPGEPILPGIALVHTVQQAIYCKAKEKNEHIKLDALRRIRFTQPVKPGETLKLNISREETGNEILFSFKITNKKNIVCSGAIIATKIMNIISPEEEERNA